MVRRREAGAVRLSSCQGAKPRNWTLVHPYRGLCVSDVVELDLSFLSIILSPSSSPGRPSYGSGSVLPRCAEVRSAMSSSKLAKLAAAKAILSSLKPLKNC